MSFLFLRQTLYKFGHGILQGCFCFLLLLFCWSLH